MLKEKLPGIQENVLLKNHTTYKIGGPARYFFVAKSKEEIANAINFAKELKLPVFILGGGSNVLFSDKGFKGLVIKIANHQSQISEDKVLVDAGVGLTEITYLAAEKGLSGLEWAAGIPGTVGGAIFGHAQAFNIKISDSLKSVEAINLKTLKFKTFTKEECQFSLKNSFFKKNRNWVIVSAVFSLQKGDILQIKNKIKEFIDYRKTNHPIEFPSAGSTFVNPQMKIKNKKLLADFPELVNYNEKGVIPSGYLISRTGLAGRKIGGAQISEKHCNFIVNQGQATAKDVLSLIKLAKEKVKKVFKVELKPEVILVGFKEF